MSAEKSEKELAFLQDLFVASDWGERFAELIDEHIKLPKKGRALYVAAGTGGHAMALQERAGDRLSLVCVDESEECLELARAKAMAVGAETEFSRTQLEALGYEDEQFDLVIGEGSLVAPERLPEMLAEMIRVAAPDGTVALSFTSASSFGEFFSVYWEALQTLGIEHHEHDVESLIKELPTIAEVEAWAAREGLDRVESWTRVEEFNYGSGEEFLNSPLITDFLLRMWLADVPDEETQARITQEIARAIDEDRRDLDFTLSVKATLVVGRKLE